MLLTSASLLILQNTSQSDDDSNVADGDNDNKDTDIDFGKSESPDNLPATFSNDGQKEDVNNSGGEQVNQNATNAVMDEPPNNSPSSTSTSSDDGQDDNVDNSGGISEEVTSSLGRIERNSAEAQSSNETLHSTTEAAETTASATTIVGHPFQPQPQPEQQPQPQPQPQSPSEEVVNPTNSDENVAYADRRMEVNREESMVRMHAFIHLNSLDLNTCSLYC